MPPANPSYKGRGAADNPTNRFESLRIVADDTCDPDDAPDPRTQFLRDASQSIISYNDSPDVGFSASINPYRGCEHGCVYCYARPTHEYLGFSAGLDFETRIVVKDRAPDLLRRELSAPGWKPQPLALSGVTDCYQPVERRLGLTRACLEVLAEFRNPVIVVTKNFLVTRDIDLLADLASHRAAAVYISLTTLDPDLARIMEPRTAVPSRRLKAIEQLATAGIPVGALLAPLIPALNDHEIPQLLSAAAAAGAHFASFVMLRLPHGLKGLFEDWLERHFAARKAKVLNRIRQMRGGRLNDPGFRTRMRGSGEFAEQIRALFSLAVQQAGLARDGPALSTADFRRPGPCQLSMFD